MRWIASSTLDAPGSRPSRLRWTLTKICSGILLSHMTAPTRSQGIFHVVMANGPSGSSAGTRLDALGSTFILDLIVEVIRAGRTSFDNFETFSHHNSRLRRFAICIQNANVADRPCSHHVWSPPTVDCYLWREKPLRRLFGRLPGERIHKGENFASHSTTGWTRRVVRCSYRQRVSKLCTVSFTRYLERSGSADKRRAGSDGNRLGLATQRVARSAVSSEFPRCGTHGRSIPTRIRRWVAIADVTSNGVPNDQSKADFLIGCRGVSGRRYPSGQRTDKVGS